MPVYKVIDGTKKPRLIDAPTRQGARSWAARDAIQVTRATSHETHELAVAGVKIEKAHGDDDKP
jgi:hypothetical protein